MANDIMSLGTGAVAPAAIAHIGSNLGKDMAEGVSGMQLNRISIDKRRFSFIKNGAVAGQAKGDELPVIIIGSQRKHSRVWYAKGFNANAEKVQPDCYSHDGDTPAADAKNRQSNSCVTCKQNEKGSAQNGEGKACGYKKRIIVTPANAFQANTVPEPYLFLVNGMSMFGKGDEENHLYRLGGYSQFLNEKRAGWPNGVPPFALVTRIVMDPEASVPAVLFGPARNSEGQAAWLPNDEALRAYEYSQSDEVQKILALSAVEETASEGGVTPATPARNMQNNHPTTKETKPMTASADPQLNAWIEEQIASGDIDADAWEMVQAKGGLDSEKGRAAWDKFIGLDLPTFPSAAQTTHSTESWVQERIASGDIDADAWEMVQAKGGLDSEKGRAAWDKLIGLDLPAVPAAKQSWLDYAVLNDVDPDVIEMVERAGGPGTDKGRSLWMKFAKLGLPSSVDLGTSGSATPVQVEEVKPPPRRGRPKKDAVVDAKPAAAAAAAAPAPKAEPATPPAASPGEALAAAFASFDD